VPKIVAAVAVLAVAGPWMMSTLVDLPAAQVLQGIPARGRTGAAGSRGPGRSRASC
jgi:hypothetical protein